MTDGVKAEGRADVAVKDVAELLAESMGIE